MEKQWHWEEYWLRQTPSTMDAARQRALNQDIFLVVAISQLTGRGAHGNSWLSPPGNIYLTIGISKRRILPNRAHLIPLETGLILHETISRYLSKDFRNKLMVKWPNDLLLNEKKTCGVLIEANVSFYFIGIGINTCLSPIVTDGGRASTCLAEYGFSPIKNKALTKSIFQSFQKYYTEPWPNSQLITRYSDLMNFAVPVKLREKGCPPLQALKINKSGHLKVKYPDGQKKWLISDYLF